MDKYTIYCTEEQTKKAFELGAPIEYAKVIDTINGNSIRIPEETGEFYLIPTAEQMLGWLEEQFFSEIDICKEGEGWCYDIFYSHNKVRGRANFYTRQEATLVAIDAALKYLSNKEK